MGIAIKERRAIVKELHGKYARMTKTQKRNLLDQIVAVQGYNRNYAARLLRGGHRARRRARTGQVQRYGAAVHRALVVVWRIYDGICGKRMAPQMSEMVRTLMRCGELTCAPLVAMQLSHMSAATIDRLLKPERKAMAQLCRSRTRPGLLLKHQVPTRTYDQWREAGAYMKSKEFGLSFLAVAPSQMRTVPINASIPVEHHVGTYDQIQDIIAHATSPFAVLKCVCREASALRKKHCTKTTREETCLAWGAMAAMVLRRKHGREVSREEALATLRQNEADGLVLQPGNAQRPEFVCGCCGCCCGMLSFHKMLPRPVDFWTTNFHAVVDHAACTGCGVCVARCQVKAISISGTPRTAKIDPGRCIGCGLCVPTCPAHAMQLAENKRQMTPPPDDEALYDTIMAKKKGRWGKLGMLLKVMLRIRQ